jgi:hypothetical protein
LRGGDPEAVIARRRCDAEIERLRC